LILKTLWGTCQEPSGIVLQALIPLGSTHVTLDLRGFRSGSLNEALAPQQVGLRPRSSGQSP
jgi:PP-loop superfamily ATP-utilizing enzyme